MIDRLKCVRCCKEMVLFQEYFNEAQDYEEELCIEGIRAEPKDVLCDECANELVEREQVTG